MVADTPRARCTRPRLLLGMLPDDDDGIWSAKPFSSFLLICATPSVGSGGLPIIANVGDIVCIIDGCCVAVG